MIIRHNFDPIQKKPWRSPTSLWWAATGGRVWQGKSMKVYNRPHGIWRISFSPTLPNVAAHTKRKGFKNKNMFDLWKSSIPWIQETCDTFEATKPILFWTFDSIWLSELSSAFFRRRRGCFCYALRVSDASTAKFSVSSGSCATSLGALLGLEAQVTERKPKITRSAATSVHHVLQWTVMPQRRF